MEEENTGIMFASLQKLNTQISVKAEEDFPASTLNPASFLRLAPDPQPHIPALCPSSISRLYIPGLYTSPEPEPLWEKQRSWNSFPCLPPTPRLTLLRGCEARPLFGFSFLSQAVYNHNICGHKFCGAPHWQVQLLCAAARLQPPQKPPTYSTNRALWYFSSKFFLFFFILALISLYTTSFPKTNAAVKI